MIALGESHRSADATAKRSSGSSKSGNWALLKKQPRH